MANSRNTEITRQFSRVTGAIKQAVVRSGRRDDDITLVAVSKTFSADVIRVVLQAGHRVFGENRVQEAGEKWPKLRKEFSDINLHLIGPLQTNKTATAVDLFDCIETLDRPKLARAIAVEMAKQQKSVELFIQVNTGAEPQKAGVLGAELPIFLKYCQQELKLSINGLMCIPPVNDDPLKHFSILAGLATGNGLPNLSMGMSSDFSRAIASGATHVRVGTAIFGQR